MTWLAILNSAIITAIVGAIAVITTLWTTEKSKAKERALLREMKLSEYRQTWINSLRDTIAEFGAVTSDHNADSSIGQRVVGLVFKIEMLMNPADPDFDALRKALKYRADAQTLKGTERLDPTHDNLIAIAQRILKREWDRLKDDLRKAEEQSSAKK